MQNVVLKKIHSFPTFFGVREPFLKTTRVGSGSFLGGPTRVYHSSSRVGVKVDRGECNTLDRTFVYFNNRKSSIKSICCLLLKAWYTFSNQTSTTKVEVYGTVKV